jgi:hypothetical protein
LPRLGCATRSIALRLAGAAAALAAIGCGGPRPEAGAGPSKAPAYDYPPPVHGHLEDVNVGAFYLVDGLAYTASGGAGTVVYVTSEPVASPALAGSDCPMTQARALTLLRDAGWVEVTLDERGRSQYFASGTSYAGRTRESEVGGRYWSSKLRRRGDGTVAGRVEHDDHGGFEFELPLLVPRVAEVSESDRFDGRRGDPSARVPSAEAVVAAYRAVRAASLARDLEALLAAQGFTAEQIAAVSGLAGIEEDLAAHADRFLEPGTPVETRVESGFGGVAGEGVNSQGKEFWNYYQFTPCGAHLVLVDIGENPR